MRILLIGANGQIGYELSHSLRGLNLVETDRSKLDLLDLEHTRQIINEIKPTLIINAAAYTSVEKAEKEKDLAMHLNAAVPEMLAKESVKLGATLLQYSSDYVFSGDKKETTGYFEDDLTNPCNFYGRTKLAGEKAILASGCVYLIFRTSWIYSKRRKNFLLNMLQLSERQEHIYVVIDQIGAPTWSRTVAESTAQIIFESFRYSSGSENQKWWKKNSGIYHVCASGFTSWYGFAEAIFDEIKLPKKPKIEGIQTRFLPILTNRPSNSRMCLDKLSRVFGIVPPHWRDALSACISN